jgi:hypothetical protein
VTEKKAEILLRGLQCNPESEILLLAYLNTVEAHLEPEAVSILGVGG